MNRTNVLLAMLLAALTAASAQAEAPKTDTEFVRFITDPDGGGMLETAAVTYRNSDGVSVTLIGAIHIADPEYFAGLNESFDHYDALLYEMVKPKNAAGRDDAVEKRKGKGMIGWVGPMQKFMRDNLELAYQLDAIEYDDRSNFVHADLDVDTFMDLQEERDEGFVRLFIRAYKSELSAQKRGEKTMSSEMTPYHLLAALKAGPDRARQLKLLFAKQLGNIDGQMKMFEGPNGSVIITERNKRAFEVLNEQMTAGKKNIGVFYGAGHFPDMEKRLIAMGFKKVGQSWRTAWDLRGGPATRPSTTPAE